MSCADYGCEPIRSEGTQKNLLPAMETREELYSTLGYHAYERKLDELFERGKRTKRES